MSNKNYVEKDIDIGTAKMKYPRQNLVFENAKYAYDKSFIGGDLLAAIPPQHMSSTIPTLVGKNIHIERSNKHGIIR